MEGKVVVDAIFDSVCRCLGAPATGSTRPQRMNGSSQPIDDKNSDLKRRTDRLQLKDKQYDSLFKGDGKTTGRRNEVDSQVVAKAKLSAHHHRNNNNHHHHRTTNHNNHHHHKSSPAPTATVTKQRRRCKSPSRKRDLIFRSKNFDNNTAPKPPSQQTTSSFRRFLDQQGMATALCFATPIHDEEDANEILKSDSDTNTLNTCEDTITSTLYFENKYRHLVEKRPPMPLFNQFKVDTHETDQLRRIVATDSHNSMRMIRIMESNHSNTLKEEEEEEEEEEEGAAETAMAVSKKKGEEEAPQAVATDGSCSTASSKSFGNKKQQRQKQKS